QPKYIYNKITTKKPHFRSKINNKMKNLINKFQQNKTEQIIHIFNKDIQPIIPYLADIKNKKSKNRKEKTLNKIKNIINAINYSIIASINYILHYITNIQTFRTLIIN